MKNNFQSGHEYQHQPTSPVVLNSTGTKPAATTTIIKPGAVVTRMNVMRFIQDFTNEYCTDGIGNYVPTDEATILKALDKFFPGVKW